VGTSFRALNAAGERLENLASDEMSLPRNRWWVDRLNRLRPVFESAGERAVVARAGLLLGLATLALFVVGIGLGARNGAWVVAGVAIVAAGVVALLVFAVVWYLRMRSSWNLVYGVGVVRSASRPPASGLVGRCDLELTVHGRGLDGTSTYVRNLLVPVSKWPDFEDRLPVRVDRRKPWRLRVLWDDVQPHQATLTGQLFQERVALARANRRRHVAVGVRWLLYGLAVACVWLVLAANRVRLVEAYTLPLAAVCLLAGYLELGGRRWLGSWWVYGPALVVGFVPTTVLVTLTAHPGPPRRITLLSAALAVAAFGVVRRVRAPLLTGGAVFVLAAANETVRLGGWLGVLALAALAWPIGLLVRPAIRRRRLRRW
jgi:hypothetical protein